MHLPSKTRRGPPVRGPPPSLHHRCRRGTAHLHPQSSGHPPSKPPEVAVRRTDDAKEGPVRRDGPSHSAPAPRLAPCCWSDRGRGDAATQPLTTKLTTKNGWTPGSARRWEAPRTPLRWAGGSEGREASQKVRARARARESAEHSQADGGNREVYRIQIALGLPLPLHRRGALWKTKGQNFFYCRGVLPRTLLLHRRCVHLRQAGTRRAFTPLAPPPLPPAWPASQKTKASRATARRPVDMKGALVGGMAALGMAPTHLSTHQAAPTDNGPTLLCLHIPHHKHPQAQKRQEMTVPRGRWGRACAKAGGT